MRFSLGWKIRSRDTIGVGIIFGMAGAGGVVSLVAGSLLGASDAEMDLCPARRHLWFRGRLNLLSGCANRPGTMKTMRRTSTLGLVLSAAFMALVAALLTAVTKTGASGAYAFLLTGITA